MVLVVFGRFKGVYEFPSLRIIVFMGSLHKQRAERG